MEETVDEIQPPIASADAYKYLEKPDLSNKDERVAQFDCTLALKALAEENRLKIMKVLVKGKCSVKEIAEELDMDHTHTSSHVRILHRAGLLEFARDGQQKIYAVAAAFLPYRAGRGHELDLGWCRLDFNKIAC